jgi:hypothetical protein
MKVSFAVTFVGSALGFVLPASADDALVAASPTHGAVPSESDASTGHAAIKDHHPKRPKKQSLKPSDAASSKSAPSPSSATSDKHDSSTLSDSNATNASNSATEPRLTLQYWNYYPTFNAANGDALNGAGRLLIPFKVDGIQQIFHILPSVATDPNAISGPRTGLGDTQIYNLTVGNFDLGQSQSLAAGLGPLLAVPTATSTNFGPGVAQGGAAGVIQASLNWGIVGLLAQYQHTLSGAGSQLTTVQPTLFYNFPQGWYFRSDAVMSFNTYRGHTTVIPVGIGLGKVFQLPGGYLLNLYAEAQPSLYRSGPGASNFQLLAGVSLKFPLSLTSGWNF